MGGGRVTAASSAEPAPARVAHPWAYRRYWRTDLLALALLALAAIAFFAATDGDLNAARRFFDPLNSEEPFPGRLLAPWRWLHRWVALPVVISVVGAVGVLAVSLRSPRWSRRRRHAAVVLLAFALGPGLLVNMLLKNHWGRPRPVQVREFGGRLEYRGPLDPGGSESDGGKSFPCGHSSAGYAFTIFFLIFRRQRPRLAALWLMFALVYGTALGIGRMAAGGHFASDVVGSALLVHAVNVALYFFILNVPGHEDAIAAGLEIPTVTWRSLSVWTALAIAVLTGALLATPHRWDFDIRRPLPTGDAPITVRLRVVAEDIRLSFDHEPSIRIEGHYEGFGSFNGAIRHRETTVVTDEALQMNFEIVRRGRFTEMDGRVHLRVPADGIAALEIEAPQNRATVEKSPAMHRRPTRCASARLPHPSVGPHRGPRRRRAIPCRFRRRIRWRREPRLFGCTNGRRRWFGRREPSERPSGLRFALKPARGPRPWTILFSLWLKKPPAESQNQSPTVRRSPARRTTWNRRSGRPRCRLQISATGARCSNWASNSGRGG